MIIQNCQFGMAIKEQFSLQLIINQIDPFYSLSHHRFYPSLQKQILLQQKNVSIYTNIGKRSENLDTFDYHQTQTYQLFGIYDGHGDSTVSNYLKCNLIKCLINHPLFLENFKRAVYQTFETIQNQILALQQSQELNNGSVAIIVLIIDNLIYTVNLGDCRAILIDQSSNFKVLSKQHNLNNQHQYNVVKEKGGIILKRGSTFRLNGQLNISRSFGDGKHKPFMSSTPEISVESLRGSKYIVIGSDGFWNQTTNKKVAESLNKNTDLKNKAQFLYNVGGKAKDNSTIICITLNN